MRKYYKLLLTFIVALVTLVATTGVASACWFTFHQPQLPENLRK